MKIPIFTFDFPDPASRLHHPSVDPLRGIKLPEEPAPPFRSGASAHHLVVDRYLVARADRLSVRGVYPFFHPVEIEPPGQIRSTHHAESMPVPSPGREEGGYVPLPAPVAQQAAGHKSPVFAVPSSLGKELVGPRGGGVVPVLIAEGEAAAAAVVAATTELTAGF